MQNLAIYGNLLWQFIEAVLGTFASIIFVIFVDATSITDIVSSHIITDVSAVLFKYL